MPKFIDLTGEQFGKLIALEQVNNNKRGKSRWLCECDCKNRIIVLGRHLKSGHTQSCGCLQKKMASIMNTTHGHWNSITYRSWDAMIQRCTNPNNDKYEYYGGRGIKVCKRWLEFSNFLEDMGERPLRHTIERRENDKGYCKSNCHWATKKEQMRNTRRNHLIPCFGKTQCIAAWSEETGISQQTIECRLRRGWSPEKVLTTMTRKYEESRK